MMMKLTKASCTVGCEKYKIGFPSATHFRGGISKISEATTRSRGDSNAVNYGNKIGVTTFSLD